MSIARNKRLWVAALMLGAGAVLALGGCANYWTSAALSSFDFCSVFNCTGGSFFNVCEPTRLFEDCPVTTTTTP